MTPRTPWEAGDTAAPDRIARLVEYFRENGDRFTPEALRQAAMSVGYSSSDVDSAWSQLAWGTPKMPGPAAHNRPGMGTVILVLAVIAGYGFTILLALLVTTPASYFHTSGGATTVMYLFIAAMVVGGLFSVYRLLRAPATGGGARAIGIAFGISIAIYVGLSGLCIAGLSAQ
jgi:hypothetical protein